MNPHTIVALAFLVVSVALWLFYVAAERKAERASLRHEDRDALARALGLLP